MHKHVVQSVARPRLYLTPRDHVYTTRLLQGFSLRLNRRA
jgi:hypothetical protein